MIKIAICDSQRSHRERIREYCQRYFKETSFKYEVQEFTSGESFLETDFPDILFVDVDLKKINGLLIKYILEMKHADTRMVFVSQKMEEMGKAFGRNVYGFFQKPLSFLSFQNVMEKAVFDLQEERLSIFCKRGNSYEKIYQKDIIYIKSCGRYTKVYIRRDKEYRLSDRCLSDWYMETRDSNFVSCHRCYLVNMTYVKAIDKQVVLLDGTHLPVAKNKQTQLKEIFEKAAWRNGYGEYDEKVL